MLRKHAELLHAELFYQLLQCTLPVIDRGPRSSEDSDDRKDSGGFSSNLQSLGRLQIEYIRYHEATWKQALDMWVRR